MSYRALASASRMHDVLETQEVLSSLVRHGTASGSYLIAYSLLQHENHHLVKTFFSLNRKATNQ